MREIRLKLGLTAVELAHALGYSGKPKSLDSHIRRYECDGRVIPPWIARLVWMFDAYGVPDSFLKGAKNEKKTLYDV